MTLIAGTTWLAARQADLRLRSNLLQQARMVANSLDPDKLARLSGTAADLAAPEYQRLKNDMERKTKKLEKKKETTSEYCRLR